MKTISSTTRVNATTRTLHDVFILMPEIPDLAFDDMVEVTIEFPSDNDRPIRRRLRLTAREMLVLTENSP